ncbi:MAG: alkyl/aryl-sulfatase [Clostridium sp.]
MTKYKNYNYYNLENKLTKFKKNATKYTCNCNEVFAEGLGIDVLDPSNPEYELAKKGVLKLVDKIEIKNEKGEVAWSQKAFSFLENKSIPATINPSLWFNGKSNHYAGVFSVVEDKIIQVRGFDIANLTLIRSENGWIVLDTMTTVESSKAAIALVEEVLNEDIKNNIKAVIISHSHADHFGGIKGVVDEENVGKAEDGKIPIFAPDGFVEASVSENIYVGTAMNRRAEYQFGRNVKAGEKGSVSVGLGQTSGGGTGKISFITPTDYIKENKTIIIDGLEVEFQLTPGTEAPTEMNNYFPKYRAFWAAENCTGTLHNLYPIRGALVRDANEWARYIGEAIKLYGDKSDVVFQSHNWPHWNTKENPNAVKEYLRTNAAVYKYIHDQTLLYANEGYTAIEIAEKIRLPKKLINNWYIRPYYGSLEINSRAVFQRYLGFYDGNPINLNPLNNVESAKKYIEYIGEEKLIEKAKEDFKNGNYRWVAEITNKLVFANPKNLEARYLCADAFEQLGYQAESGIWRNAYLLGAQELREGVVSGKNKISENDLSKNMTSRMILEYLGIVIDSNEAQDLEIKFNLEIIEPAVEKDKIKNSTNIRKIKGKDFIVKEKFLVDLTNGALLFSENNSEENISYVRIPREALLALLNKNIEKVKEYVDTDNFNILLDLQKYVVNLGEFNRFNIIEP